MDSKLKPLTLIEIREVVEGLPWTHSSIKAIKKNIRKEVKKRLSIELRNILLEKNQLQKLKDVIYVAFLKALIQPGTPIGMLTAEAIMAPVTQATLNTFHHAGTEKGANMGITPVKENISASSERKNPQIYAHFKNKNLRYEDIFAFNKDIVEVSIQNLITNTDTLKFIRGRSEGNENYVDTYLNLHSIPDPRREGIYFQRIRFDTTRLYANKILLSSICEAFRKISKGEGLVCIPSPTYLGIIDVHFDSKALKNNLNISWLSFTDETEKNNNIILTFIKKIFEPCFKKEIVRGLRDNYYLEPLSVDVLTPILIIQPCLSDPEYKIVRIDFSSKTKTGIPYEKIIDYFELCEIPVVSVGRKILRRIDDETLVESLLERTRQLTEDVRNECENEYYQLNIIVKTSVSQLVSHINSIKEKAEGILKVSSSPVEEREWANQIVRMSKYFYARVGGTNLHELLLLSFVDPRETYSESYHHCAKIYGIDVTRSLLISEEERQLADPYINPAFIINQVNTQTSLGIYTSMSSQANVRRNVGALPQASFDKSMDAFAKPAPLGRREDVDNTSSCISLALPIRIGTGHFDAIEDEEMTEMHAKKLRIQRNVITPATSVLLIPQNVRFSDDEEQPTMELYNDGNFGLPPPYRPPPLKKIGLPLPMILKTIVGLNIHEEIRLSKYRQQDKFIPDVFYREIQKIL